ncbi:hypothetical protein, partial [Helicobacter burdigaliensis]|uniref:hypothetical protein n=1 Tax=Helicobacter burdigaliensis TaxID=2315334 RepID=UPI0039EC895F
FPFLWKFYFSKWKIYLSADIFPYLKTKNKYKNFFYLYQVLFTQQNTTPKKSYKKIKNHILA